MEAKDLILLMLIPIILVSLVFYVDKSPSIIGAVTQEPKQESNILGTYSVNPSFKTKIEYSLDDYNKIKESLDFIIKCSEEGKDIETCIKEINEKDASLKWELNCDKGAEKILYDFAGFYQDCFDSDDTNCLCRKSFEFSDKEVQTFGLVNQIYRLQLDQHKESKQIEISMQEPKLSYQINTDELSVWYPSGIVLAYSDKLRSINMIFRYKKGEEIQQIDEYKVLDKKEILLYKNKVNNLKRVDFVEQIDNSFIFPNKQTAVTGNLHPCQLKPKNIYKFCVTQNNYKVIAYDKLDGQIKERNPVIKFASYVPDLPPAPLKNLEAFDRPKAEKSVLLKWDKSDEKDIVKFRIYYADSSLKIFENKVSTEELRKNSNVFSKEIDAKAAEINAPFKLNDCEFDYQNKKCMFPAEIESGKLYYSSFFNVHVYSLNVPEDTKNYDFSVTAVDRNSNEINNIDANQKLPVSKNVQSADDLPPSSENIVVLRLQQIYDIASKKVTFNFGEKPKKNIDTASLNDSSNYRVYYMKYNALTQEEKAKEMAKIRDGKLKNIKFLANINYEQQGQPFFIDLAATNPESNNVYFFIIAATDIYSNPKEEQYRPKELGAQVLQLVIP